MADVTGTGRLAGRRGRHHRRAGRRSASTCARWPRPSARFRGRSSAGSGSRIERMYTDSQVHLDVEIRSNPSDPSMTQMSQMKPPNRVRLSGVRRAVAEVAGPLRRLRRVELARRGARRAERGAPRRRRRHRYALAGAPASRRGCTPTSRSNSTRGCRPGIDEFDRVLGGGVVPGSLVLLGGEPGIGKSTLLLQAAANMARTIGPVLYSSGEESEHQIKSRGERLARRRRAAVSARRNLPRADPRGDRPPQAGARHRRLDPDGVLAQVPVGARQHRPGARGGDPAAVHRQGPERADVPRRPRHEGRQPRRARRRSSTSSTPCCTSKASAITRTASCARSRTGSAPSASSASSR